MSHKIGFAQKLKVAWFLLTSPTRKHIQAMSCEFCGSMNIRAADKRRRRTAGSHGPVILYSASFRCENCGAECAGYQKWSRASEKPQGDKDYEKQ